MNKTTWNLGRTLSFMTGVAGVLTLAILLWPANASAQVDVDSALLQCDSVKVTHDRLACFNRIVRALKSGNVYARAPAPVQAAPPSAAVAEPERNSPLVVASRPPARPSKADTRPSVNDGGENFGFALGLWKRLEGNRPALRANVVRHWRNNLSQLVVELDNGQVWTEIYSYSAMIPEGETDVEIKAGRFGGYRMRIGDAVGLVQVKRLK